MLLVTGDMDTTSMSAGFFLLGFSTASSTMPLYSGRDVVPVIFMDEPSSSSANAPNQPSGLGQPLNTLRILIRVAAPAALSFGTRTDMAAPPVFSLNRGLPLAHVLLRRRLGGGQSPSSWKNADRLEGGMMEDRGTGPDSFLPCLQQSQDPQGTAGRVPDLTAFTRSILDST